MDSLKAQGLIRDVTVCTKPHNCQLRNNGTMIRGKEWCTGMDIGMEGLWALVW